LWLNDRNTSDEYDSITGPRPLLSLDGVESRANVDTFYLLIPSFSDQLDVHKMLKTVYKTILKTIKTFKIIADRNVNNLLQSNVT